MTLIKFLAACALLGLALWCGTRAQRASKDERPALACVWIFVTVLIALGGGIVLSYAVT